MSTTKKTRPKKEPKPRRLPYDEVARQLAAMTERCNLQQAQINKHDEALRKRDETTGNLRAIIATLEREKAGLEGYVERVLQEQRAAALKENPSPAVINPRPGQYETIAEITPFCMPHLNGPGAGIEIEKGSGYGSSTIRKPWHQL